MRFRWRPALAAFKRPSREGAPSRVPDGRVVGIEITYRRSLRVAPPLEFTNGDAKPEEHSFSRADIHRQLRLARRFGG